MDLKEFDQLLRNHDWYYHQNDTASYYQLGRQQREEILEIAKTSSIHQELFEAYKEVYSESRSKRSFAQLDQLRVKRGVITQEFLDELIRERNERNRLEAERKLKELREYDGQCMVHDWYYWTYQLGTPPYEAGYKVRFQLTKRVYNMPHLQNDPYTRLFRAWAAYKSALPQDAERLRRELDRVRVELEIAH